MPIESARFPNKLLQAINDWQIGGSLTMKQSRGRRLKHECSALDSQFRIAPAIAYRRLELIPKLVWELHDQLQLKETISAWTLSESVAKSLKGGVPRDSRHPGLILRVTPTPESVVVNLEALYKDPEFVTAHSAASTLIKNYHLGIGRHGSSQDEVILELDSVPMAAAHALGGYSSDQVRLARLYFGGSPSAAQLTEFDQLLVSSGQQLGPRWIVGDPKNRVLRKSLAAHAAIRARKSAEPHVSQDPPLPGA